VVTTRRGLASDSDKQFKSSQSSVLSNRGSSSAQSSFTGQPDGPIVPSGRLLALPAKKHNKGADVKSSSGTQELGSWGFSVEELNQAQRQEKRWCLFWVC
jgi:hypothetical protein